MAKKLFKLAMTATTTTSAVPTVYRYFYQATGIISTTSFFILKSKFVKDNGSAATALQTRTSNNGYYLLFVNGELQQSGIYTVGAAGSGLTIAATAAITIPASGVVSLSTTNFAPSSTTTVSS